MGAPRHFSSELPERCLHLIHDLFPSVLNTTMPDDPHSGPLTTTFLYAMALPIILLPLERVHRHRLSEIAGGEGYMDDRHLSDDLARAIDRAIGGHPFAHSPFFEPHHWQFHEFPYRAGLNLVRDFPEEVAAALAEQDASTAAARMPAEQWASCLRNALAHGGVTYLDYRGRQSGGARAEMFAFTSASYPATGDRSVPRSLRVLRITEGRFLEFLNNWVGWLSRSGLSTQLAA